MRVLAILAVILCMGAAVDDNYTLPATDDDLIVSATWHVPATTNDRQVGPTQLGPDNECPYIPYSFPTTYPVSNLTQLNSALAAVQPGEAIIVQDGVYNFAGTVANITSVNGTTQNPVYIIAETTHGVEDWYRWDVRSGSSNIVLAGFRWTNRSGKIFEVNAPNIRVACNSMENTGGFINNGVFLEALSNASPQGNADDIEIDNNLIQGAFLGIFPSRCNYVTSVGCTSNHTRWHIHHNTFRDTTNTGQNGRSAISVGLGYNPAPGVTPVANNPDASTQHMLIENNLFDSWAGEEEIVDLKSGGTVFRYNCVVNTPGGLVNPRQSNSVILYGNWFAGGPKDYRWSGDRQTVAFNYFWGSSYSWTLYQMNGNLSVPQLVQYIDTSDSQFKFNVVNSPNRWILAKAELQPNTGPWYRKFTGTVFENNNYYSTNMQGTSASFGSGYTTEDGSISEAQFRIDNTWATSNILVNSELATNTGCFDSALFDGPGDANSVVTPDPSSYITDDLTPPSWWN